VHGAATNEIEEKNLLYKVMRAYDSFEGWVVREEACRVFANLSYPLGARAPGPPPQGVIKLLMAGLLADTSERTVNANQCQPAHVKERIAALVGFMQSDCNVQTVSHARGVYVLLNALRRYGDVASMCVQACLALTCLAQHDRDRVFINKSRGIQVVLSLFHTHSHEMAVLASALDLLAAIVAGFPNHQKNFRTHMGPAKLKASLASALDPASKRVARGILLLCKC